MKNENKNAMPGVYNSFDKAFKPDGLTKLEYAAIHIAAGLIASRDWAIESVPKYAISTAKQIFKQIEDDNTTALPDSEL